jgi:hypothetical protein
MAAFLALGAFNASELADGLKLGIRRAWGWMLPQPGLLHRGPLRLPSAEAGCWYGSSLMPHSRCPRPLLSSQLGALLLLLPHLLLHVPSAAGRIALPGAHGHLHTRACTCTPQKTCMHMHTSEHVHAQLGQRACTGKNACHCLSHGLLLQIADLIGAGKVRLEVALSVPLEEVQRAHQQVATGHTRGKVVLTI